MSFSVKISKKYQKKSFLCFNIVYDINFLLYYSQISHMQKKNLFPYCYVSKVHYTSQLHTLA